MTATAVVPAALSGGGSATAAPGPARSVVVGLADGGDPTSASAVDPLPARVAADADAGPVLPVATAPAPVAPVVAAPARVPGSAAAPPAAAVPPVEPVEGEPAPPAVEVSIPALLGPPQLLVDPDAVAAPPAGLHDPRRGEWRSGLACWRGADGASRAQDAEGDGELPDDAHLVPPGGAPPTAGPSTRASSGAPDGPAADASGRHDPGGA